MCLVTVKYISPRKTLSYKSVRNRTCFIIKRWHILYSFLFFLEVTLLPLHSIFCLSASALSAKLPPCGYFLSCKQFFVIANIKFHVIYKFTTLDFVYVLFFRLLALFALNGCAYVCFGWIKLNVSFERNSWIIIKIFQICCGVNVYLKLNRPFFFLLFCIVIVCFRMNGRLRTYFLAQWPIV